MRLKGGAAVVTGGGTGMGAATAVRLARKGANVVVNYSRSAAEAEATAEACRAFGGGAKAVRADVSCDEDCRALVAVAVESWGRLDVLVNSAGTTRFIPHGISTPSRRRSSTRSSPSIFVALSRCAAPRLL